jgi:hypothetical protein
VSGELIRIAILWHEQWHEALEEASRWERASERETGAGARAALALSALSALAAALSA